MYSFDDIKGNPQVIDALKTSINNNTVSHAYIFEAPEGMGKLLLAKAFAKALLCINHHSCDKCNSCISFDSDNNPDIIYVKSDKKSIGVSEIREQVVKNIEIKPFLYEYKVFIIEDAHTLTIQAQNSLLKTLEEPKQYGVFILLSDNLASFLPTILSRCVLYKLKPLDPAIIKKHLTDKDICTPQVSDIVSSYSQGSIGKAVTLANSEEFLPMRESVFSLISKFKELSLIEIYKSIKLFEQYKDNIQLFLDIIYLLFRDAIVFKSLKSADYIVQKDKVNIIKAISSKYTIKQLIKYCEAVFDTKILLMQNANFQMSIEVLLFKLKEN